MRTLVLITIAWAVQALSMCGMIAALTVIFGNWPLDQTIVGFGISFVFAFALIPVRLTIPFLCGWMLIHAFGCTLVRWFIVLGGFCGLFVFMTLPDVDEQIWAFKWRDIAVPMKRENWFEVLGLSISATVSGLLTGLADRSMRH